MYFHPTIMKRVPVTVIILTLNEEHHLPRALDNILGWAYEVFVVDSLSTDRTVDIALQYGVQTVQHPFSTYGDQWNWALDYLPIKTPWVLKLDADERIGVELKKEIEKVISNEPKEAAFIIPVRIWFFGERMHPKITVTRLWRNGKARFSNVFVNEHLIVTGRIGRLHNCIEHHDSHDLHRWWEKQNRYTTMRAIEIVKGQSFSAKPRLFGTSFERRMFFVRYFFSVPLRYQLQWLYEMFVRGAWKDGKRGLEWVRLRIHVRRLCELKVEEMRATGRILEMPPASKGEYDSRISNSLLQESITNDRLRKNHL